MNSDNNDIDTLYGIQAAMVTVLGSLISTHPDYQQLQLHLARLLDSEVLEKSFGQTMSARQIATARSTVEQLQRIAATTAKIDPLANAGFVSQRSVESGRAT